jgi:uncharacterized protein YbaR (Trm112 family)
VTDNTRVAAPESEPKGAARGEDSGGLEPWIIDLLVCPVDTGVVTLQGSELVCSRCGRRYPVRGGIANMLPDHAKIEQ